MSAVAFVPLAAPRCVVAAYKDPDGLIAYVPVILASVFAISFWAASCTMYIMSVVVCFSASSRNVS